MQELMETKGPSPVEWWYREGVCTNKLGTLYFTNNWKYWNHPSSIWSIFGNHLVLCERVGTIIKEKQNQSNVHG